MPVLDHFRPPVSDEIQWNSFHSAWASTLATRLNEIVPAEFRVHENLKLGGGLEIDVAAIHQPGENGAGTPFHSEWQPDLPLTGPIVFPDRFEVLVFRQFGGRQLVGAIELISPGNKDSRESRDAFVSKVCSYLHEAVSVLIVDVVTERRANLHNEIVEMMRLPVEFELEPDPSLYAASYRPVLRDGVPALDIWAKSFAIGAPLPTMPLRLIADYFVPVELEATYTETCRRRRLI
jgi:hypothetical protein